MKDLTNNEAEGNQTSDSHTSTHTPQRQDHGDRIHLAPFEELCGRLIGLQVTDVDLVIQLSAGTLEFPLNSTEVAICKDELEGYTGEWVSILRTSDSDNPLLVNRPKSTEDTQSSKAR